MTTDVPTGLFLWHELMTPDPDGAIDFYRKVVGWGLQEWEEGDPPYRMFTAAGTPTAGCRELPAEARARGEPPHWVGYVATGDVDTATARAVELGGEEVEASEDVPSVGRIAMLRDPRGALIGAFTPDSPPADAAAPPTVGRFSWNELSTPDPEGAFDFYSDVFGWEETRVVDMGEMGSYRMFGVAGRELGGIYRSPDVGPGPAAWIFYTRVDDLDEASGQVGRLGGDVVNGPMEVPGGDRVVQCTDPRGAFFALHEVVPEGD